MAIRHSITLSTSEPNNEVGNLKIRQGDEQTQTLVANITENGVPKPFTGLQPFFCAKLGQTAGLGIIEQKVIGTMNPANGTLEYVMQPEDWQQLGRQTAYFSFRKMVNDHEWTEQFSTRDFNYNVTKSAFSEGLREVKKDGSTYVWTIEDMLRLFKEYIATGKIEWENYKNDERTIWEKFVEDNREFLENADPGGKIILELLGARGGATTLRERLDSEKAEVSARLQQIATVSADDMIKLENGDVTKGLQRSIDTALTLNKARVLWAGTYEVNKTLVIERLNEDNNPQIVFFGGGQLKKAPNFTGDRLLQIKIGFHDEDNIVFENISFDGVNNTINGVDTFDEQISYKEDGSKSEDGHQSKFISFNNCTFHRFYRGARLSSLSYNFISCFFQNNVYGTFLNLAANNNSFIACQFRRNGVGVHIKQLSGNYGTMNNAFFNCIFESNRNSGLIVDGAGYVSLFGGYFENNCYNIDNTIIVPPINCDILSIGWGGVGRLLVDGVFFWSNNSPVAIYGDQLPNVTVKNSGNIKISAALIENGDFDLELENISIRDVNYPSTFLINGVRYGSKKGMIHMIADYDKGVSSKVTHVSYNVPITDLSNVSIARFKSNTTDVSEVRIKIFLNGLTSGGNTSHEGYIERDFFISRSTKPLETFNAKSIGNTRIGKANSDSGSGDGVTTKDLLQDTSELILTSENYNEQKISVTNLINDSMINWGQYNHIEAFIVIEMVGFQTTFTLEDFPLDPITFIN